MRIFVSYFFLYFNLTIFSLVELQFAVISIEFSKLLKFFRDLFGRNLPVFFAESETHEITRAFFHYSHLFVHLHRFVTFSLGKVVILWRNFSIVC